MSQYPPQPSSQFPQFPQQPSQYGPYGGAPVPPRRISGLAIAAFVCSLIFCCPLTTLTGIVLGAVAMLGIKRDPSKSGRGLAIAAIIIGVIATALQAVFWTWATMVAIEQMGATERVLNAAYAGNYTAMRAEMHPQAQFTDAEMDAVVAELRDRYGDFIRADSTGQDTTHALSGRTVYLYRLVFDNQPAVSAETVLMQAGMGSKPMEITIFDPALGDLTIPPTSSLPTVRGATRDSGTNGDDADLSAGDEDDAR